MELFEFDGRFKTLQTTVITFKMYTVYMRARAQAELATQKETFVRFSALTHIHNFSVTFTFHSCNRLAQCKIYRGCSVSHGAYNEMLLGFFISAAETQACAVIFSPLGKAL